MNDVQKRLMICMAGALCFGLCTTTLSAQQLVNLLANPGTNADASGWTFEYDEGLGAVVEASAGYGATGGLLTGYDTRVSQDIDLLAIGYSEAFLDGAPIIRFADWFKGTGTDVADQYRFAIELKDANGDVIVTHASDWYSGTADFQQVKHNFINYGAGLRTISVARQSWDAEYDQSANLGNVLDAAHLSIGNHLLNSSATTGDLSGWTIESNGGDGWYVRDVGGGALKYQTSYETCTKSQTIDLLELGYTEAELDMQPLIDVWEYYWGFDGPTDGTGFSDTHFMNVELRDGSGNVMDSFQSGNLTCTATAQLLEAVFTNYGTGLREIYVQHGGIDAEYWQGHYGGFADATQLTIDFNVVGIEETIANNKLLVVYPNPTSAKAPITIALNNEVQGTYQVAFNNMLGQTVFQIEMEKTSTDFETSFTLPSDIFRGVYLISIRKDDFVATRRVVIE